jgi:pyridoxine/pyridoxamine 5'-phosphate oxidase
MQHTREDIFKFMNSQPRMVLSTLSAEGIMRSAVVGFGQTEKFELIFGTHSNTVKAQNILQNSNVSAVIGFDHNGTIQYEGNAYVTGR